MKNQLTPRVKLEDILPFECIYDPNVTLQYIYLDSFMRDRGIDIELDVERNTTVDQIH